MNRKSSNRFVSKNNMQNNKQAGFSLVQVMVGVGVMGIIMAGMTAMQANQSKEIRALNETLARAELDRNIIAALSDGKVCTFLFNAGTASAGLSPANAQFTAPATPPAPPAPLVADAFTLNMIPVIDSTSAPSVVEVDKKAAISSNTLYIDANKGIKINITGDAGSGRFTANLVVSFDNTTASRKPVRQMMPLTFPISLQTTSTSPGSYTVKSCQLANGQGTANYIAKWQSMTSLDNSVIYQDPTNGNIGIGTAAPGAKLEVAGAAYASGGARGELLTNIYAGIWSAVRIKSIDAANGGVEAANANAVMSLGDYNTTNKVSLVTTGNVGIGIKPSTILHVMGTETRLQTDGSYLSFYNTSGVRQGYIQHSTDMSITNERASSMFFRTNNVDRITIDSTGKVGIGTTIPGAALDTKTSTANGLNVTEGGCTSWNYGGGTGWVCTGGYGAVNTISTKSGDVSLGANNSRSVVTIQNQIQIKGGAPGAGKVLTASDTNGNAYWASSASIPPIPIMCSTGEGGTCEVNCPAGKTIVNKLAIYGMNCPAGLIAVDCTSKLACGATYCKYVNSNTNCGSDPCYGVSKSGYAAIICQ